MGAELRTGRFLDAATARYPSVVLGAGAADQLGIDDTGARVWLGGRWFSVIGILEPVTLAPALDGSALVGFDAAARWLDAERDASTVYVRAAPDAIDAGARDLLAPTANPERPEEVEVSRPSDALAAKAAAKTAFTSLFLGLGAVALLVGGVGIANVMVISVLERRSEVGLRRALGATRRHVGAQFACESLLLAAAGGAGRGRARRARDGGLRAEPRMDGRRPARRARRGRGRGARHRRGRRRLPGAARGAAVADGRAARGVSVLLRQRHSRHAARASPCAQATRSSTGTHSPTVCARSMLLGPYISAGVPASSA